MAKTAEKKWTWHFPAPPEAIWRVLADTARFNEAAGFPKHQITEEKAGDGSIIYVGRAKFAGFDVAWHDIPVDWVDGQRFTHCRHFLNGPFVRLCATLTLEADGEATKADYLLEVEARNLLGRLLMPRFMRGAESRYARIVQDLRDFLAGDRPAPYAGGEIALRETALARIDTAIERIESSGGGHGLASRIADLVTSAQEVELMHMRPLELAGRWKVRELHMVEACLEAVRAGLLGMGWQILCPRCRGAKVTATSLDELPTEAHCNSCNVDYQRDFAANVELTFHPSGAIRPVDSGEFCLFGPMSTPHVKLQQHIGPGQERRFALRLRKGSYRFRTLNGVGEADFEHRAGALPSLVITDGALEAGEPGKPGELVIVNRGRRPEVAVVEERAWVRGALTAVRVTAMQRFRDLFSADVLRPGDEVAIERIALMFTDLLGSTALYGRIGDAAAYHLVREHFAFLAGKIREHQGAIVKTIGDAVMAAFADPGDALRAALDVQRAVAGFNEKQDNEGICIKLGLHEGPVIAVTLNDRLDYFGTTVNLAARLQGQSAGGDIVLSEGFAADPGVVEQLKKLKPARETARIKGFRKQVPFLRLDVAGEGP
ncbi:MAG: adenylate/guanylate cyclase domain-containing protein [Alphaproteobacteria bacterium]